MYTTKNSEIKNRASIKLNLKTLSSDKTPRNMVGYSVGNASDVLKNFQDELGTIAVERNASKRLKRIEKQKNIMERQDSQELKSIQNKLKSIRVQLEVNKSKKHMERKLDKLIFEHQKTLNKRNDLQLPRISQSFVAPSRYNTEAHSPYHYPHGYPFPPHSYPYPPYPYPFPPNEESEEDDPVRQKRRPAKKDKLLSKQERERRKKRLVRIMKKTFRAVAYIFYLKKLAKDIRVKRRSIFDKFWPQNFQKSTTAIRKWFSGNCKRFFDQMEAKSEVQVNIDGEQSDVVLKQKSSLIKRLIQILIDCLNDLADDPTLEEICQIVLLFCKHGALIENGVVTQEEAETVSISDTNGYLRLDRNLEKSQILNFLFMKIIIYNMLLQPWKYNPKLKVEENHQNYENFYFVSSVFYQIVSDLQNQYLEQPRSELYQLGNWSKQKAKFKVKFCPSLIHLENNYQRGEMISGLVPEKTLDALFPKAAWHEEIDMIKQVVEKLHNKLRKAHWKLINSVYCYKDMSVFQ